MLTNGQPIRTVHQIDFGHRIRMLRTATKQVRLMQVLQVMMMMVAVNRMCLAVRCVFMRCVQPLSLGFARTHRNTGQIEWRHATGGRPLVVHVHVVHLHVGVARVCVCVMVLKGKRPVLLR